MAVMLWHLARDSEQAKVKAHINLFHIAISITTPTPHRQKPRETPAEVTDVTDTSLKTSTF